MRSSTEERTKGRVPEIDVTGLESEDLEALNCVADLMRARRRRGEMVRERLAALWQKLEETPSDLSEDEAMALAREAVTWARKRR